MFNTSDPAQKDEEGRAFAGDDVIAETPVKNPGDSEAKDSLGDDDGIQGGWPNGLMD